LRLAVAASPACSVFSARPAAAPAPGTPAVLALHVEQAHERNLDLALARRMLVTAAYEFRAAFHRLQEDHAQLSRLDLPVGHHGAGNLVDRDVRRKLYTRFPGCALQHLKSGLGVERSCIFSEPD